MRLWHLPVKFSLAFQNIKYIIQLTTYTELECYEVYKCSSLNALENYSCATIETCIEHYAPSKMLWCIQCTQFIRTFQDLCYLIYESNSVWMLYYYFQRSLFIIFDFLCVLHIFNAWNVTNFKDENRKIAHIRHRIVSFYPFQMVEFIDFFFIVCLWCAHMNVNTSLQKWRRFLNEKSSES